MIRSYVNYMKLRRLSLRKEAGEGPIQKYLAGLIALVGGYELYDALRSHIVKDKVFEELVKADPYIAENKDKAKAYYETLVRINPAIMTNPAIAHLLVREAITVGGVPIERVKSITSVPTTEPFLRPLRTIASALGGQ